MNDSPISHDSGTLLRAPPPDRSEPAPLPRLRGVSPLASAILLSATNTSKVTQFIASRYIPKPRSITGLKARNMPAPLNDTRPHLHAHTMPHATSPTAVSNHQATLCLLTFRSHRIRPSSIADRAAGERKQRHEYGENACGRRIGRLTAVAANVAVAGGAAAVRGSCRAMGDGEHQERY